MFQENESIRPGTVHTLWLPHYAVMHDEYYRVMRELEELTPEEMISDLIAATNTLEALKAELGAEE